MLPIALGTDLAGAIALGYNDDRPRAAEEISILAALGERIAVALDSANRDLELHRRAHYDAVTLTHNETSTGVTNDVAALARAVRDESPDTLVLVDAVSSLAGIPVVSIPNGLSDGLPVGFQIAGPAFSESRILDAAHAFEQAIGFDVTRAFA